MISLSYIYYHSMSYFTLNLESPFSSTISSFTSCQVEGIAGSERREGVCRRQAGTADCVDGAPQSGAAAGQKQRYRTWTVDVDPNAARSGREWIWARHLSELSLSTEVMWARLFPGMSLLLGPEPPEGHHRHVTFSISWTNKKQLFKLCRWPVRSAGHLCVFTWTFIVTCSHSSKCRVPILAWKWSRCR